MKAAIIIPTWNNQCGVAEYTKQFLNDFPKNVCRFQVIDEVSREMADTLIEKGVRFVHFQYEHSIYDYNRVAEMMKTLRAADIPIITTLHSWSPELMERNVLISHFSDRVIVHSEAMKKQCMKEGFPEHQLTVMPIGCRRYPLQPPERTRKLFNMTGGPFIGFFGFPFPHKGIESLISSLDIVKDYFPNLRGYFFSHYPDYLDESHPYYQTMIKIKETCDQHPHLILNTTFLPEPAVVNLLHCMDVNVLPYKEHEQMGISSATRMMLAAKKPVITSNTLYFSDLSEEVFKMSDHSAESIASSILRMLLRDDRQRYYIQKSAAYIREHEWENVCKRYGPFYQSVISQKEHRV